MKLSRSFVVAASAVALFAGCAKKEDATAAATAEQKPAAAATAQPVAIIDGTPVSKDVWDLWVKTRTQGRETSETLTAEQRKEFLDSLVRMYVAANTARQKKLETGEVAARNELMVNSSLAELISEDFLKGKEATEEEMRTEYETQVARLPKTEYHARHILVATEQFAKDLIGQLDKGAKFEELAEKNSMDSSKSQGGELPWSTPAGWVKPFADAVQTLEKGAYTKAPVKSEFGWHIIKLEDTRPLQVPPFDAVKQQVGRIVLQKKFEAHLDELAKAMKVERKLQ